MEIKLPLRYWKDYKREHNKESMKRIYSEYEQHDTNIPFYLHYYIKLKYCYKYIHFRVFNEPFHLICNKISIQSVSDKEQKILKNSIFKFEVTKFLVDDIGFYVIIHPCVNSGLLEADKLKHKEVFRTQIWEDLMKSFYNPIRLQRLAEKNNMEMLDYVDIL